MTTAKLPIADLYFNGNRIKPHFRKTAIGMWECGVPELCGFGSTVAEAYADWVRVRASWEDWRKVVWRQSADVKQVAPGEARRSNCKVES